MIIWLNGTFGVGKTTTARLVCDRTEWRMFDPEHVGYMVAANLKDFEFDDFQELAPWRALVPAAAQEIHDFTNTPLAAVQTVLVEDYWFELAANFDQRRLPVFHVLLDCDSDELRRRIEGDEVEHQALDWRLDHIEAYGRARPWLTRSADLVIDTTDSTPGEVAESVVAAAAMAVGSMGSP